MYEFKRTNEKGFTFVEMLVAITILILAVVGPLYLAAQGLRAARIARDQITANYLAQEAVEYIRWIRDNNALQRESWLNGLSLCTGGACQIDVFNASISACDETCPRLRFFEGGEEELGVYGYDSGWPTTKFTRTVFVDNALAPDKEALITVTVSWQDGIIERTHALSEYIYNWNQ